MPDAFSSYSHTAAQLGESECNVMKVPVGLSYIFTLGIGIWLRTNLGELSMILK